MRGTGSKHVVLLLAVAGLVQLAVPGAAESRWITGGKGPAYEGGPVGNCKDHHPHTPRQRDFPFLRSRDAR